MVQSAGGRVSPSVSNKPLGGERCFWFAGDTEGTTDLQPSGWQLQSVVLFQGLLAKSEDMFDDGDMVGRVAPGIRLVGC